MSGFSAAWLALREPADQRARAPGATALDSVVRHWGTAGPGIALDLGSGTGSNRRWLAPRLPAATRWTLVDHDPALLELARAAAATESVTRVRALDLARQLDQLEIPRHGLVTAAALLDLVSADWLDALAARCHAAAAAVVFALTYDGRCTLKPMDRQDRFIVSLVNQHQRRDKGFGPALGPLAAAAAARAFAARGYRLCRVQTDWRIDASEPALQDALLAGWAMAATEQAPAAAARIAEWLARRRGHLVRGRSWIGVGHEDLYGWPEAPAG